MNEREAFDAWWADYRGFYDPYDGSEWAAWQARAAVSAAPTLMAAPVVCPFGCETQEEHDKHYHATQPAPKPLSDEQIDETLMREPSAAVLAMCGSELTIEQFKQGLRAIARAVLAAAQGEQK
jgi:hypothetical protein